MLYSLMDPPTRPRSAAPRLLFALGCALFALLGHGPVAAAPIAFTEPSVIPAVGTANSLSFVGAAKGDFNGDGHILWNAGGGVASLWNVTGSAYTYTTYGPFSGWVAVGVSARP